MLCHSFHTLPSICPTVLQFLSRSMLWTLPRDFSILCTSIESFNLSFLISTGEGKDLMTCVKRVLETGSQVIFCWSYFLFQDCSAYAIQEVLQFYKCSEKNTSRYKVKCEILSPPYNESLFSVFIVRGALLVSVLSSFVNVWKVTIEISWQLLLLR